MDNAREVSARLLDLLRREQSAMAEFLVALADFDRERGWVELGHSSLFYFLHRELGLSAGAAWLRKTAAELIQRIPELVDPLRDGRLCLSSIGELAKVLTPENIAEVLPRFFHASKQEAKAVAAELAPMALPPQRIVVTALPERRLGTFAPAAADAPIASAFDSGQALHPDETETSPAAALAATARGPGSLLPPPASSVEPLTAELRRLHVTVSKRFLEKLAAARDALSHSHPGADEEAILEAGLDLLIERAAKRKGFVKRPRNAAVPPRGPDSGEGPGNGDGPRNRGGQGRSLRAIPAAVRREVWLRDGGRCQWPTAGGGVCGSTRRVELDHVVPVGRGGEGTVANLRVCCAFHNDLAAREVYGDAWMNRFRKGAGSGRGSPGENARP